MNRPLRIEFPGALYHVTARGDRRSDIFRDDSDRLVWMRMLGDVCAQSNYSVHAFCQMGNHYHLLLETLDGGLSQGMRQLNGVYSQYFNRRHDLVGHVLQGRYQAILVQKETYLLELARYIVLNPVRAGLVTKPESWPWSSYRLTLSDAPPPPWLETRFTLRKFGDDPTQAIAAYRRFVLAGIDATKPVHNVHNQLLLGDSTFIERFQSPDHAQPLNGICRTQRATLARSLQSYQDQYAERDEAIANAYASNAYTLDQIARHFGISPATAGRAVKTRRERLRRP